MQDDDEEKATRLQDKGGRNEVGRGGKESGLGVQ